MIGFGGVDPFCGSESVWSNRHSQWSFIARLDRCRCQNSIIPLTGGLDERPESRLRLSYKQWRINETKNQRDHNVI